MERRPPGASQDIGGGNTLNITNDQSWNDNSSHHHGDYYNTSNHYYGGGARPGTVKGPQDRLEEYVSKGAAHDSAERGTDAPKCFPETREAVQAEMLTHIDRGEARILWLSGPAGAGKTAIMGSIADECHARRWLAGSFFFSTSAMKVDRCSKRYLIPTFAYHLLHLEIPGLREAILSSIEANPWVFDKQLSQQLEILILTPIRKLLERADASTWPKVILVDGVDECAADEGREYKAESERQVSKADNHREVLSVLMQATSDPSFPFRVVIASRPERAIEGCLSSLPPSAIKKVFLDSKYSPEADMELYARGMLTKIGMDCGLAENWYARAGQVLGIEGIPRYWAQEASEQFVYVATVIRYIQNGSGTPHERLVRTLNWRRSDASDAFAALDTLYRGIIQTTPKPVLAVKWIRTALTYSIYDAWYVRAVLESSPGETGYLLGPLSSLIRVVNENGEPDFQLYHKSLSDFLVDPQRSGDLFIPIDQITAFESGRYSEVLRDRGPQVPLPDGYTLDVFWGSFCHYLPDTNRFPPAHNHHHDAGDVDWWLGHHHLARDRSDGVPTAFGLVHEHCRWYSCRPACKVWRKGILRFAKANNWHVPTTLSMLQDRFKPIPVRYPDGRKMGLSEMLGPEQQRRRIRPGSTRDQRRQNGITALIRRMLPPGLS